MQKEQLKLKDIQYHPTACKILAENWVSEKIPDPKFNEIRKNVINMLFFTPTTKDNKRVQLKTAGKDTEFNALTLFSIKEIQCKDLNSMLINRN